MKNQEIARDYITRARKRIAALDVLFQLEAWADVVRESQETVELALKGVLRLHRIETPRIHDVSDVLREEGARLTPGFRSRLDEVCEISRRLRRDRELAFYGSEDLTPSDFYRQADAHDARSSASLVVSLAEAELNAAGGFAPGPIRTP